MWLQDYLPLLREIFATYIAVRLNVQRRLHARGVNPKSTLSLDPLGPLVDDFAEAVAALGVGHQLVLRSDLPEVRIVSSPPRCWVALSFQFEVVRSQSPMVLRMTHLGELHHFAVNDPTADEIVLEVLPHLRIAFVNGALCGARRFHLALCSSHRVMVETTPMPFPLLPFLVVRNEPSTEWLLEAANAMDRLVESFSQECRKRVRPPASDLVVQPGNEPAPLAALWQQPLLLRHGPR